MSRTAHAHPWMGLALLLILLATVAKPSGAQDVEQLTQVVLDQQAQIQDLEYAARSRQAIDDNLAGRIDAIDCDLYGLICPASERIPVRVTPRSSRSHARTPRIGSHRPPNFAALARCESTNNPRAVSPSGRYRGLYQFDLTTWRAVGGHGDPIDATPAEQTKRAQLLYADRGRAPWPVCGRLL